MLVKNTKAPHGYISIIVTERGIIEELMETERR